MATSQSAARPGARAHYEAITLSFPELVSKLTSILGKKLTAYIAGKNDVRAVDRWIQGQGSYKDAEPRLRLTYQVVVPLSDYDKPTVVQSWLTGINPALRDRVPIRLLRDENLEVVGPELLAAMRSFIAGG
jgi:hypothetical protein